MFYIFKDVDGREIILNRERITYTIKSWTQGNAYYIYTNFPEEITISSETYQDLLARLEPIPLIDSEKES